MSETIDMSLFFGCPDQKQSFCDTLLHSLKTRGCAKLRNHGIADSVIHNLFDMTRKFFALSHDAKMQAKHPMTSNPNRGYSFVGQENVGAISGFEKGLGPGTTRDMKETFDMGAPNDDLMDNIWIAEGSLPGFRGLMEKFYDSAYQTEMHLLAALSIALGIRDGQLTSMHSKAENEFRLLHYPPVPASLLEDGKVTRIAEHTDFGTITMLFQDSVGGLQVEDQTCLGTFHNVECSTPTELLLNIGDSLQRLTNDTFKAACHRVTYPPNVRVDGIEIVPERFSIAYFAKPNRTASLRPMKTFIDEESPCRYNDMTFWDWSNVRIAKLFSTAVSV